MESRVSVGPAVPPAASGRAGPGVTLSRRGGIGLLCIDHAPVNALSPAVVAALDEAVAAFEGDGGLDALLVHCAGRTFVAGGDIAAFDAPDFDAAPFNRILARLEGSRRLVLAALHGTALGGGLELALACHYRIALADTRVGLPEVRLGLLPGSLGSQRLPRACGAELALELMLSGRMLGAEAARAAGIVDAVAAAAPVAAGGDDAAAQALAAGLDFLRTLMARGAPPRRLSERPVALAGLPAGFFAAVRTREAASFARYPARAAIVRAVEAAATLPFAQGEAVEAELLRACVVSEPSRALRHLFFAERRAAQVPGLPAGLPPRPLQAAGVVGGGAMGSAIAAALAGVGLRVVLVEADGAALAAGLARTQAAARHAAARGRLSLAQAEAGIARLEGALDLAALAGCDLVVEAVYEDMALKQQVFARLGRVCRPGAILASHTATLDVEVLADASGRPADVLGMHLFSPAGAMRLLEVVRAERTAPEVLATALALARRLGKVPVVSGVCYGFIGNRMAEAYLRETEFLLQEGVSPQRIDAVAQAHGMAMGPCRALDLAGVDVAARAVIEYGKAGGLPPDPAYRAVVRRLYALGRHGQKSGAGLYRYAPGERTPRPDAAVEAICRALARETGVAQRAGIGEREIAERLFYPLVNEAARLLEEGVASRPGDIDMVWTAGYGFPDYLGGPVWLADRVGLARIVAGLERYGRERGNAFDYWDVSPLLASLARHGGRLSDWSRAGAGSASAAGPWPPGDGQDGTPPKH